MTPEMFTKIAERCSVGGALPIAFVVIPPDRYSDIGVRVILTAPDVNDPRNRTAGPLPREGDYIRAPRRIEVVQQHPVRLDLIQTEEDAVRYLAALATKMYAHELREWFVFGEERVLTPHEEHPRGR